MKTLGFMAIAGAAVAMTACQSIPRDMSIADYCANPKNTFTNVCRSQVQIDGNTVALRNTDLRVSEAMRLVDNAQRTANTALLKADTAQGVANAAQARADQAYSQALQQDDMVCETRTIQKTNVGSCRPGYTLMSCTQSRFTYRAGGPSILREINDKECRFNDRVLEMKARCCAMASAAPQPVSMTIDRNQPETYPRTEKPTTQYRY